jgi:peptidoglycan/LPS O-acetylase OafA/YrhL
MKSGSQTYFQNLDATRVIAFLHAFFVHAIVTTNPEIESSYPYYWFNVLLKSAYSGLDYFFILSSFLITWLALEEHEKTGRFRPDLFLVRRSLRIWPLYFLLVGLIYGAVGFFSSEFPINPLPPIQVFLLFYSNFWMINHGQEFLFMLVFFWSIAVEEQFYLFWAFVLCFFKKHLNWICFVMIAISLIFRATHLNNNPALFFSTFGILGNFGLGALGAIAGFRKNSIYFWIKTMSKTQILLIYLGLIFLTVFYFPIFVNPVGLTSEKIVFGLFFVFIILEQCFAENSLFKLGKSRFINYLGRLALGPYCYHGIILTIAFPLLKRAGLTNDWVTVFFFNPILILAVTFVVSILSYELYEKHIHRLRRFFYPNAD